MSRRARIAWCVLFAVVVAWAVLGNRACMADREGCALALEKYDGYRIPRETPISR